MTAVGSALIAATIAMAAPVEKTPAATPPAAPTPDTSAADRELLRATAARYRSLDTYEVRGTLRLEVMSGAPEQSIEAPFVVAYRRPGRLRDEFLNPGGATLQISDGTDRYEYLAQLGQYRHHRHPVPDSAIAAGTVSGGLGFGTALMRLLGQLDDSVTALARLPDEQVAFDGGMRPCAVLEATYPVARASGGSMEGPRRFWIDPKDHRVLRIRSTITRPGPSGEARIRQETRFELVRLGGPVADSLFEFTPPPGSRAVHDWETPGQPQHADLTGNDAPDFELTDLNGHKHKLSDSRGKVVLLDFWATWCGPCRITMPLVDKIEREYRSRGLVVYSINLRETHDAAAAYIRKKGYGMTTLLDGSGSVGDAYQVNGIPALFIVGGDGKISAQMIGVQQEEDLRDAIEDAGVR
ncbi:MAG: redoxin domain-containing protein [Candidatus Eisenbacteria bacterium]